MDVYSSMLNLNFMASLRTGNIIVDMIIAMLIPLVSGFVSDFFRNTWPSMVRTWVSCLFFNSATTHIMVCIYPNHYSGVNPDLTFNETLVEAVSQYVSTRVAPRYDNGNMNFKRTAQHMPGDVTLLDAMTQFYSVVTVPGDGSLVDLPNGLQYRHESHTDDSGNPREDGDNNRNQGGGGGGGGKAGGAAALKEKKMRINTLKLIDTRTRFTRDKDDAVYKLAADAFAWYKERMSRKPTDDTRYLYQPLIEPAATTLKDSDDSSTPGIMRCQRYPLSHEKTFKSLFFPSKANLLSLINDFEAKRGKFAIPGFPHKLVLLLYGPPGTGKTSLVKAMADYTNRHIVSIPLSRVRKNRQLMSYMHDGCCEVTNDSGGRRGRSSGSHKKLRPTEVIYMLEDVDAASEIVLRNAAEAERRRAEEERDRMEEEANEARKAKAAKEKEKKAVKFAATGSGANSSQEQDEEEEEEDDEENSKEESEEQSEEAEEEAEAGENPQPGKQADSDAGDHSAEQQDNKTKKKSKKNKKSSKDDTDGDEEQAGSGDDGSEADDEEADEENKEEGFVTVDRVAISNVTMQQLKSQDDRLSLAGLLSALGGVLDVPGRMIVMTTNHIEHLDEALVRPGVVTMKLLMGTFTPECAVQMVQHYFGRTVPGGVLPPDVCATVAEAVSSVADKDGGSGGAGNAGLSPAELEQMCAENETVEELIRAIKKGHQRDIF